MSDIWNEHVLPLLVFIAIYAAFFKTLGSWVGLLERRINTASAEKVTFNFGRLPIFLLHCFFGLVGIVCSTGMGFVILFQGSSVGQVLAAALLGSLAFATQSVTGRVLEAAEELP